MNRLRRRTALAAGLMAAMVSVGIATATPGSGAVGTLVARGTLDAEVKLKNEDLKLQTRGQIDLATQTIAIAPGGHTGWHSHPGPVLVTVIAGILTLYDGDDPSCSPVDYGPAMSFVDEGAGHVHIARNEGATEVVLYATYLLPVGAALRTDVADPGTCTF